MLVHELGIEIEQEEVQYGPQGFGGDQREAFLAINPNGKVPVLQDGDMILWESNAIMAYLADLHGDNPLWPADLRERAQIAMWQFWQAAHLTPAADGLFYQRVVSPMIGQKTDEASVAKETEAFHRWASILDARLAEHEYLALGRFTCADISVAAALMYADKSSMPIAEHSNFAAWFERIRGRGSWIETEPKMSMG